MPRETLLLRLPADLKRDIMARAAALDKSANQFIIEAIEAKLGRDIDTDSRVIPSEISDAISQLGGRVEAIEARLNRDIDTESRVISSPNLDAGIPVSKAKASTDGLTTGEALAAAGALPEAQAIGSNRDQRMLTHYGMKGREWLRGQGWEYRKRRWYPPET